MNLQKMIEEYFRLGENKDIVVLDAEKIITREQIKLYDKILKINCKAVIGGRCIPSNDKNIKLFLYDTDEKDAENLLTKYMIEYPENIILSGTHSVFKTKDYSISIPRIIYGSPKDVLRSFIIPFCAFVYVNGKILTTRQAVFSKENKIVVVNHFYDCESWVKDLMHLSKTLDIVIPNLDLNKIVRRKLFTVKNNTQVLLFKIMMSNENPFTIKYGKSIKNGDLIVYSGKDFSLLITLLMKDPEISKKYSSFKWLQPEEKKKVEDIDCWLKQSGCYGNL